MKRKKEQGRLRGDSGQHRRILAVGAVLGLLAFLPPVVRLYSLMVKNRDFYTRVALDNQTRITRITGDRGTIYDRNMQILAWDQPAENVYLAPAELRQSGADLEQAAAFLGGVLEMDPGEILKKAGNPRLRYQQIAAEIDRSRADAIRSYVREQKIAGIHLEPGVKRCYPEGRLASQVIGFTNASHTGCEGVEAAYNSCLEGSWGQVITTKGNNEMDMPFSYEAYIPSRGCGSVILTLDATVQKCLENQMQRAMLRYDVQNGAFGMVMNAKTGEILAMATLGGYDPNDYLTIADEKTAEQLLRLRLAQIPEPEGQAIYAKALQEARLKQWRNRCISDGYEPGSTFKVLTMAAALDCGAIDLNTDFYCRGAEQIPGRSQLLHCWRAKGHGPEKTPQALQNSCNIAFAHIALKLGGERFYDYMQRFGIMEKTGIDLTGESKGVFFSRELVTDTDRWGTASLTSGSFGQTFKLTPLQLVRGVAAVVNGGRLLEPYIVSQVVDSEGHTVLSQEPTVLRRVISPETSRTMCTLLQSVVEEGTAKNAAAAGFAIGGKTGTSEKIDIFDDKGRRVLDKIVSFIGVAPMDDPEYIVLVALDTPSRTTGIYISGGVMAAPTVGAVMEDILPYLGVRRSFSPDEAAGQLLILEDYTGLAREKAEKELKSLGIGVRLLGEGDTVTGQIPGPGEAIPGDSQVILYCGQPPLLRQAPMPDFHGMTRQQAADTAGLAGFYILVKGNQDPGPGVTVTAQSVPAGRVCPVGTTVALEFTDTNAGD